MTKYKITFTNGQVVDIYADKHVYSSRSNSMVFANINTDGLSEFVAIAYLPNILICEKIEAK